MVSRTLLLTLLCMSLFAADCAVAHAGANLVLSIEPDRVSYSLDEAKSGGVTINARFRNSGENDVFIAHPSACVPDTYNGKGIFRMEERYGNSEILMYITSPDGEETVLRHNFLRGFEPGNRFGLKIAPGGSEEVRFGWLGPYFALGMWDDLKEPVFTERGEYSIRVVYRNYFKKAFSFGDGGDIYEKDTPWTGELVSDTVSVRVE